MNMANSAMYKNLTMYKVTSLRDDIVEVEVSRFNDKSVWRIFEGGVLRVGERREKRFSDYGRYYETRDEAREYLIARIERRVKVMKEQLLKAETALKRIEAMT
jgi:hypothetical protein